MTIAAYVLAGGQSRRFGTNKALYPYEGQPLIEYPLNLASSHFSPVRIIAKTVEDFAALGYPVVTDRLDSQSPLVGLYTGLQVSDSDWNCFLACDMPLVTGEVLRRLQNRVQRVPSDVQVVIPRTDWGLQPLCACYHRTLLGAIPEVIGRGYSLKAWIQQQPYETVYFSDTTPFRNINRKQELYDLQVG